MLAASRGHVDMTSFLVSALADVNAVDIYLRTTLHMVVRHSAWFHLTATTASCFFNWMNSFKLFDESYLAKVESWGYQSAKIS